MQITGTMFTNLVTPNNPAFASQHWRDVRPEAIEQPTDIMVYVRPSDGEEYQSGARRVYHSRQRSFYIKLNKRPREINMVDVMRLMTGQAVIVAWNPKGAWRK